ncbi:MAG: hypothetical protein NC341_00825 [Blautia sp.]|nr:hypothetical protein [Blautia sp.]MCM1202152.1 hypothetical protein [Bacteroides fragilis]
MKKVIYNALCFNEESIKAPNAHAFRGGVETYLKNSFVSLMSAKYHNSDCDVILIANNALPDKYASLFSARGIKVLRAAFDNYTVPQNFMWEYAFYKLKALEYIVNNTDYEYILGLDSDTYVADGLEKLWTECEWDRPVLLPVLASTSGDARKQIITDYERNWGQHLPLVHYGGEFIAGKRNVLSDFSKRINDIYSKVKQNGFQITDEMGDEGFLSMAANDFEVLSAYPFIRRYWTRHAWYGADTCWADVPIWHLPAEKDYGILKMFSILVKKEKTPSKKKAAKIFNLPRWKKYNVNMIKYCIYILFRKMKENGCLFF